MNATDFNLKSVDGNFKAAPLKDSPAKIKLLYFSAHWCPPCRAFTPKLAEFYKKANKDSKRIEIVFISWDKDEKSFKEYFATMPWLSLEFSDPAHKNLPKGYNIKGIPTLVLIDDEGNSLNAQARSDVEPSTADVEKVLAKWQALYK